MKQANQTVGNIAMGAGFFIDAFEGSPIVLVIGLALLGWGLWAVYRERTTKSRAQRAVEQKQRSDKFFSNLNRSEDDIEQERERKRNSDPITEAASQIVQEREANRKKKK